MSGNFYSTIYLAGLRECYETKHPAIRLLWITIFITGFAITVFCMYNVIKDYCENPTVTKVYFDLKKDDSFPEVHIAVTFDDIIFKEENLSAAAVKYLKSMAEILDPNITFYNTGRLSFLDHLQRSNLTTLSSFYDRIKIRLDKYLAISCTKCASTIERDLNFIYYNTISVAVAYDSPDRDIFGQDSIEFYRFRAKVRETADVSADRFQLQLAIGNDFSSIFSTENKLELNRRYAYSIWINAKRVKRYDSSACDTEQRISSDSCGLRCFARLFHQCDNDCTFVTEAVSKNLSNTTICSSLFIEAYQCMDENRDFYSRCSAECLPPCVETVYEFNIVTTNVDDDDRHEYNAWFKLLYLKSGILTYEEVPSYNLLSAVSNIGGQLGLWLGLSVVTVIQVFLYFVNFWMDKVSNAVNRFTIKSPTKY